jgi:hypothetical protein
MRNIGFQIGTEVYRFQSVRGPMFGNEHEN